MTNIAYLRLPRDPVYRFDDFAVGLEAAGFLVNHREPRRVKPGDVLVQWNRSGSDEIAANAFEQCGGRVLVAENGYFGHDENGRQMYALAWSAHNGYGTWKTGDPERWSAHQIRLKPWRLHGDHILVCPNRFIGPRAMRMPDLFANLMLATIPTITDRPVKLRPHPGNWQVNGKNKDLDEALKDCWAVVIWSSSAGLQALMEGIPVVYQAPTWIGAPASSSDLRSLRDPYLPSRQEMFEKAAWAQWSLGEIRSGKAFKWLCGQL